MCAFESLYQHDTEGYVLRCKDCDHLQLAFGNLVLCFHEIDFDAFTKWLRDIERDRKGVGNEQVKNILLPTPCEGMQLAFSYKKTGSVERYAG